MLIVSRVRSRSTTMRIPHSFHRRAGLERSAMTPLIDVVFQLLVFFICATTGHIRELLLPADLSAGAGASPSAEFEKPLGEVWIRLRLEQDATIIQIEGTDYRSAEDWSRVLKGLSATAPEIPVYLAVEGPVPWGDVVQVYDTCRAAGFQFISFALQPRQSSDPSRSD